ncbi:MAG: hypothetical protein LBR67_01850 [Dysgonamonadaceae bacterium]|nr:hypothetical protein [Dysgonamonadaceae bacterium]
MSKTKSKLPKRRPLLEARLFLTEQDLCDMCRVANACGQCCNKCRNVCNGAQLCARKNSIEAEYDRYMAWVRIQRECPAFIDDYF